MNKHEAVKAFFEDKVMELIGNVLGFNYSPETVNSIALLPEYSDRQIRQYITGERQMQYSFAFLIVRCYSTEPLDALNMEAMEIGQAFMDWIEEQDLEGNYPDLGEDCESEKMEVLQDMPNLASVNEDTARYMIQGRIIYVEKNKE